jgi:hypothetical protein
LGLSISSAILWVIPFFGVVLAVVAFVLDLIAASRRQPRRIWMTGIALASVSVLLASAMTISQFVGSARSLPEGERGDRTSAVVDGVDDGSGPAARPLEPVREHWARDGAMLTPQFVGMSLTEAKETGEELGLRIYEEDASEEDRSVWVSSNWVVVAQDDPPGTFAEEGDQVFLRILKRDEVTTEVEDGRRNELLHTNERLFTGVVTGYRQEDHQGPSTVYIDDRPVELDLIAPVAPLCADPSSAGTVEALAALKVALAIGQRVLVVMSDPDTDGGFVHVLPDGANEPETARPAGSANEQLLRSGWWVPEGLMGGPGLYGDWNAPAAYEPYRHAPSANSVYNEYAPLLAAAAEETAVNYVAGAGDCRRAAEAEAEEWRRSAVDTAESVERYRREQEQRRNQGTYCRDGDGDGICNEG